MVPPCSNRISRVPPYSRTARLSTRTGLSPTMARLSRRFRFLPNGHWPGPRSLATTSGVSVDVLSSGYLDVSVRRVCFVTLCIQVTMTQKGRVSPFGNLRIKVCSQLPEAYRSVLRPSSPLSAKAFTKCPSALDCKTVIRRGKPTHSVPQYTRVFAANRRTKHRPRGRNKVSPAIGSKSAFLFTMTKSFSGISANPAARKRTETFVSNVEQWKRFNTHQYKTGGGERNRTDDLLLAKQALSQLSYTPDNENHPLITGYRQPGWWAWVDLNYRPHAYQACALTN